MVPSVFQISHCDHLFHSIVSVHHVGNTENMWINFDIIIVFRTVILPIGVSCLDCQLLISERSFPKWDLNL